MRPISEWISIFEEAKNEIEYLSLAGRKEVFYKFPKSEKSDTLTVESSPFLSNPLEVYAV